MTKVTSKLKIRKFNSSDSIEALTELLHRSYKSLADIGLCYLATHQNTEVTAERISKGECYIALLNDEVVGTITFEDAATASGCEYYARADVAKFNQFGVVPELQGQGIGGQLLDFVENRAKETGAAYIALDTADKAQHLISFYQKRGYLIVSKADWKETNYESVIMAKKL